MPGLCTSCSWTVCDQWTLLWGTHIVLTSKLRPKTNALPHKGHLHACSNCWNKTKFEKQSMVALYGRGSRKILQILLWMSTGCTSIFPWAADINDIAKGSLVRPSHRPSTATPIWTIHTTCHQLLWPLSWVCWSNWQPRGDPQQPWSSHNYHIRQWALILIKTIPIIL